MPTVWDSGALLRDPRSGSFEAVRTGPAWVESVAASAQWTADIRLLEHVHLPLHEPLEGLVLSHWISAAPHVPVSVSVRYDGGRWRRLDLAPGRVHVRPSGVRGAALWRSRGTSLLLALSDAFVEQVAAELDVARGMDGWLPLASVEAPTVFATLAAMRCEAVAGCPAGGVYGETLARALLMQIWAADGRCRSGAPSRETVARGDMDRVIAFMRERLAEPLTLAELAHVARLTPCHFSRVFKKRTGKPPHQYLLELRVNRACALLKGSTRPVAQVAADCGFENPSHFTRVFRRLVGTTPLHYRSN
jgi:AraC family transcriptional regulator